MAKVTKAMIEVEKKGLQDRIEFLMTVNAGLQMQLTKIKDGLKMIESLMKQVSE